MGQAAARRLASGRLLVLADYSDKILESTSKSLLEQGHIVKRYALDVSDRASVASLAKVAGEAGHIDAIIHTAGVSPAMGISSKRIHEINLLGTALVIDEFLPFVSAGTSLVCISSLSGHLAKLSTELEMYLATAPTDQLIHHKEIDLEGEGYDAAKNAYELAKRGNQLRVQAKSIAYGKKGARINTISPGVIGTPMGNMELAGQNRMQVQGLIDISPAGRIGTPDDVTNAAAFLVGSESSYITGTDILLDGGSLTAIQWGRS